MSYIAEGEIDKIKQLAESGMCPSACEISNCILCKYKGRALHAGGRGSECHNTAIEWLAKNDTQEKPVVAFEAGKWYKWVGPKEHQPGWNPNMDYMLDGLPHKCIETATDPSYADFEDHPRGSCWAWRNVDGNFREVPAPTDLPRIHSASGYAPSGMITATFTMPAKDAKFILTHLMQESEFERSARLLATIKTKN